MTMRKIISGLLIAGLLAGCGGGGGAAGTGSGGPGDMSALPKADPPAPTASRDYSDLDARTGTSPLGGTILLAGSAVSGTTGTINHANKTFTASGVSGSASLNDGSAFSLPDFEFATDVAIGTSGVAIVGVSTDAVDVRKTGTAAYTGQFSGQLVDASQITASTLNWDADMQVNFAGDGDIDLTFTGGGSSLIDTIHIRNAQIDGNRFAGGTFRSLRNGNTRNIAGTDMDLDGSFFGYNNALQLPAEAGGALVVNDADTDISGVFILSAKP